VRLLSIGDDAQEQGGETLGLRAPSHSSLGTLQSRLIHILSAVWGEISRSMQRRQAFNGYKSAC
jgi:hypothetical protein